MHASVRYPRAMERCLARSPVLGCTLALALVGCGDDASDSHAMSASEAITGATEVTAAGSTTTTTTTGPGAPTTTSGSDSASGDTTATSGTSEVATTGDALKLDVAPPDQGGGACATKCGNTDWSYVWIANSGEHTISKLDTRSMEEVGRYQTRADQAGNPSRTSVSIDARAVAVANRAGGITKIWAREEYCEDKNGNGTIETSTGKFDVLPFDQEECIAWFTAFPDATTQRPVAWTSGVYNEETCEYEDQKIWTASGNGSGGTWPCDGTDGIFVYRLNGDTGEVEDTVHMPDVTCGGTFGPYGAAVDTDNNLWMYIWSAGTLVNVDYETLEYSTVQGGSYGITVDNKSRVWIDSGKRYDPVTMQWDSQIGDLPGNGGSGVAQDLKGRIWKATAGGVGWVDAETMLVGDKVTLPNGGLARGIGVDVDGYIWAVILGGTEAFRIDPDTYEITTYDGLNAPYTYSDMAGGQINNVTCNPQG